MASGYKQEGPYKLRMSLSLYKKRFPFLLHGPYEKEQDIFKDGVFINKGYISHGCIRFLSKDIVEVAQYIQKGSRVTVLPYKKEKRN